MINFHKRSLFEYIIGACLVGILALYIYFNHTKELKFKYFMKIDDNLNQLIILDKEINSFIEKRFQVVLFDDINQSLNKFNSILQQLIISEKEHNISSKYLECLQKIEINFKEKEFFIERIKYLKAFETNILFSMIDNNNSDFSKLSIEKQQIIYQATIEFLNILVNKDTKKSQYFIQKYRSIENFQNHYWSTFLSRAEAMVESINKQNTNYEKLSQIELIQNINDAEYILHNLIYKKEEFNTALEISLWILIILLSVLVLNFYRNLKNINLELSAFKAAVEDSYNVVIITDENMVISYVNDLFEKVTGYSKQSVLGKTPQILKSGLQDDNFYKTLKETISKGEKWEGQFINKDKDGNLFYEDATITPILDKNKDIKGYLSIKRDITQNVKNEKLLEELNKNLQEEINKQVLEISQKEKQLLEQRKLVAMGEMLGNIAHQWRQPLAGISATLLNIESKLFTLKSNTTESEKLNSFFEFITSKNEKIRNYVHHLSDTIDIFRDFIKEDKRYTKCILQELIKETVSVIDSTLKSNYIELINTTNDIEDIKVTIIKGELSQVIINIINNARDAIKENNIKNSWIKIDLLKKENSVIISIEDNAGGISEDIQSKVFDPYFTTKHQSQGTGLGLHMSYKIVTESLHGKLYTTNTSDGAKFFIQLPLK